MNIFLFFVHNTIVKEMEVLFMSENQNKQNKNNKNNNKKEGKKQFSLQNMGLILQWIQKHDRWENPVDGDPY